MTMTKKTKLKDESDLKEIGCIFCHSGEPTAYICSSCVQKLCRLPQDKLQQAYDLVCEQGFIEKAQYLGQVITKEEEIPNYDNRRNAKESGPCVERTGSMCKAQSTYRKDYRKKQTT